MDESTIFLIFSLGFFLFAVAIILYDSRRSESRQDYRNDIEYSRMLNERREFGYSEERDPVKSKTRNSRSSR